MVDIAIMAAVGYRSAQSGVEISGGSTQTWARGLALNTVSTALITTAIIAQIIADGLPNQNKIATADHVSIVRALMASLGYHRENAGAFVWSSAGSESSLVRTKTIWMPVQQENQLS